LKYNIFLTTAVEENETHILCPVYISVILKVFENVEQKGEDIP
jgi:hypothetical protein